jgi:iron complex transport system ATP-binding protein
VTALLRARDMHFSFGRQAVLNGVTLDLYAGEIAAIVGPNGAGKTTLLKVLAGLLVPRAGHVHAPAARSRSVAYLAQSEELPSDWSVREVVELGRLPYAGLFRALTAEDDRAVRHAMQRSGTLPMAARPIATLSGGERRRVALARALAQNPRLLLLDEPAAHLDIRHQVELFATLRAEASRGAGVAAVVHDLGFAAHADRCVLVSKGVIRADGPPAAVLVPELLREVYETDLDVLTAADGRIAVTPTWSLSAGAWPARKPARETCKRVESS